MVKRYIRHSKGLVVGVAGGGGSIRISDGLTQGLNEVSFAATKQRASVPE